MSGQMSIQLTYLNRAFHALSIDMSHDHKHVFLILGWLPPPGGGSRVIPGKFWFMIWKYKSEPISMKKISFLSHSVWTCSPEKNSYKKTIFRSFSGHFQLLTVKWVVKWAFNWHIWIELFMGFRLICHMTQNIFFLNILGGYPLWWFQSAPPPPNFGS